MNGNIYLIGFMGCGKSTVAVKLSELLDAQVIEMDEAIASREGKSIPKIFADSGEKYFRDVETRLLSDIACEQKKIVSCGGGIILREENIHLMKQSGKVILLTATPETVLSRVLHDENRPILQGKKTVKEIEALMEVRRELYEAAADEVISTDHKSVLEICEELIRKYEG